MEQTLKKFSLTMWIGVLLACATVAASLADPAPLPQPAGSPILTLEGDIAVTNQNGKAVFDRDMLEALGMQSIITKTPWYDNEVSFEGVPVQRVMDRIGAKGSTVTAVALNDYKVKIPKDDFSDYPAILALKRDGKYMTISDKGPIFIVYPYDNYGNLHSQQYYGRSVWQLSRLIVE